MPVVPWIRPRLSRLAAVLGLIALLAVFVGPSGPASADGDGFSTGETVTGTLTHVWSEHKDRADAHGQDDLLSFVRTSGGEAVRLPTDQVAQLPAGTKVAVTVGNPVLDDAARTDGLDPARQVVSAHVLAPAATAPSPAATPGTAAGSGTMTDGVTVVMAVPAGGSRDSTTLQQVVNTVNTSVADFWSTQSGGAIRLAVTGQVDWFQATADCSNPYVLWNQAAQRANWSRGTGRHLLVYLPRNSPGCAYGLGEVGSLTSGGLTYVTDTLPSVMAHELGHNFGLNHSSQLQCDRAVDSGTCRTTSYYDLYDVMGASWEQMGSLSVAQAAQIGFLPAGQQQALSTTDAPITVTLAPVSGTTGTRAIRLTSPDGTVYWLEYRPAAGRDLWLGDSRDWPGLQPGVLLRRWTRSSDIPGDGTLLLDGTPSAASNWSTDQREALPVGIPVRFAGGVFTVTVTGTDADATVDVVPATPITVAHEAWGGDAGPLGAPTAAEVCVSGICSRSYEHGVIYWSLSTGAHPVQDPVLAAWTAAGGQTGPLRLPTSDAICGLVSGGCGQVFQGGRIYSTSGTGAHAVSGVVQDAWIAQGWERGPLGYPSGDEVCGLAGGGCRQQFQGGWIATSPSTGTRSVAGVIATAWQAAGGESGSLGYPASGLTCGLAGGGCGQVFQGGRIYSTSETGAHAVSGAIQDAWIAQGWERGPLGYPSSDQVCGLADGSCKQDFQGGSLYIGPGGTRQVVAPVAAVWRAQGGDGGALGYPSSGLICGLRGGACGQVFQNGRIYTSSGTGTHAVTGTVEGAWIAQGWENGALGYPTSDLICGLQSGGCGQVFQGGRIYSTATTGAHALAGPIQDAWVAQGWEAGPLGYPTADQSCGLTGGGCEQDFQHGTIYTSPTAGTRVVSGTVEAAWQAAGAGTGSLGYPMTGLICGLAGGGCGQVFQRGRIYSTADTGTHAVSGEIQDAWTAQGWEGGPLGYPAGDETCGLADGGCKQQFQGGWIYTSPGTGARSVSGPVATAWQAAGDEGGSLGYPSSNLVCGLSGGGCGQLFQRGRIYWTTGTGAHPVSGPIQAAWIAQGWEKGSLGYPTSDPYSVAGGTGTAQDFTGGTLTLDSATGQVTSGPLAAASH